MSQSRGIVGVFVVVLALVLPLVFPPAASAAGSGPVAYWTFDDDTANDTVGTHHGAITGSGVTFAAGRVGRAISFNNSLPQFSAGSYVKIPGFNLSYLTVSAWVNAAEADYYFTRP
jgi:hypothetical protein